MTQVMEYTALNYEKLSDRAKAPKRATPGSIGLDLFTPTDIFIPAKQQVLIHTDLILVPTQGHYIRIASKSGLALKVRTHHRGRSGRSRLPGQCRSSVEKQLR